VADEVVDESVEEPGQPPQVGGRRVGQGGLHAAAAHLPHALDRVQAGLREPHALGAPVVRVRNADDVAGLFQVPQLPCDMGRLHRQPHGEHPGTQRLALGDVAQDRHGGPVQRQTRPGHQTLVLPRPACQVGDPVEGPLDLGRGRQDGVLIGLRCGHATTVEVLA
jgi:hypothetical protein